MKWDPDDPNPPVPLPSCPPHLSSPTSGEEVKEGGRCLVSVIGVALEDGPINGQATILTFVNLEHQRLTAETDLEGLITVISDSNDTNYHSNVSNRLKFNATAIFTAKLIAENGQWELNEQGYLKIKELEVEKIKIAGDRTVGFGRIKQGEVGVTINNKQITSNSLIFVTFINDLGGRSYHISEKTAGEHFTVKLSGNLAYDADFQWWILDSVDDGSNIQYSSEPYQTPAVEPTSITTETPTSTPTTTVELE